MTAIQGFALGVGVASAIWLLVGVFVSWLTRPARDAAALRSMQSEWMQSEMRPFLDDPSTKFPMEG